MTSARVARIWQLVLPALTIVAVGLVPVFLLSRLAAAGPVRKARVKLRT